MKSAIDWEDFYRKDIEDKSASYQRAWDCAKRKRDFLIEKYPPGSLFMFGGVEMNVVMHTVGVVDYTDIVCMKAKYFTKEGDLKEHTFDSREFPLSEWLKEMPKETV